MTMRAIPTVVLMFLPVFSSIAHADEVLWAEAEEYSDQHGSVGADRPPFGSRGACLGSNWGGSKNHFALYRFRVDTALKDARLQLRYARRHPGDAFWSVTLDEKIIAERLALPSTGGWGHLSDAEWAYQEIRLGSLSPGRHTLRLVSLAEKNNTNLDGFFLSSGPFEPPNTRAEIERSKRLLTVRPFFVDETLAVEQFCPTGVDPYYPAEEAAERGALVMPRVVAIEGGHVVLAGSDGASTQVELGQSAQGWSLPAIVAVDGKQAAVFERHFDRWGVLAYVDHSGTLATIRKVVGRLPSIVRPAITYPANYEQTILDSRRDLLGEKVLALDGDPSFESCAAFLPDLSAYTFLATGESPQVVAVAADGSLGSLPASYGWKRLENVLFDPGEHVPTPAPTDVKRGLAGDYLPVIDYGFYDRDAQAGWEQMVFACSDSTKPRSRSSNSSRHSPSAVTKTESSGFSANGTGTVPATLNSEAGSSLNLYVYLRIVGDDGVTKRKYFRIGGKTEPIGAAEFFEQLLPLKRHWEDAVGKAMLVEVPEQRIMDACRASLVRAFITYDGSAPRYGVGHYAAERHATFPPTTLSMVNACVEWGLLERARRYLDYYLDHVVRDDGTFDYYGPAVSEYGQFLDVIAQYVRRSGQTAWFADRMPKIENVVERLLALRRENQAKFPKSDVRHGLIMGSPEADTRKEVNYYFSGNVWTWRGWIEMGRLLINSDDATMVERGRELLAECETYGADIDASIQRSVQRGAQRPFVPPVAGFDRPFETMTQDRFASYTNYRYWIEMLSAGYLRPEWHDAIIDYRVAHGGELLGTTRFQGHLDDWPYAGYAYGLLLRDRVRHYLLGFYGDLSMHRMRGTFTAYEQATIRGPAKRNYVADYCVPAQLVTPLLTKWMLVFEERDADVLWLCRATPRRWLGPNGGITVRRATTRWGPIDFAVTPRDDGSILAEIELPRKDFPAELRLRLRAPEAKRIGQVTLNGHSHRDFDADGEYVRIARPSEQALRLVVQ